MNGFRNIAVVLTGTDLSLSGTLRRGAASVDKFTGRVDASGGVLSKWKLRVAAAGAVLLTLISGLGFGVKAAANFQTQMQNVNSISYLSTGQLAALGDQVVQLSKTMPQSATTLAAGLYDIASSGFQGADGLTVLKASAKAASAGLSTTATSAQAITAVLNAYGLSADQAGRVSDALFQTVNLGVVSFDQLAGSIGDVVGIASQAGVNISDVGAALATMTLSGIQANEASTSLNRVIQNLIQPSDALKTLYKQLGYESGLAALKSKGLHTVMEDIGQATGYSADTMLQLFPDIRAVRGALALLTQQGDLYTKQQQGLQEATQGVGATQRALTEQSKSASFQWKLFVNDLNAGAITVGEKVLPTLVSLMHGAEQLGAQGIATLADAGQHLLPVWREILQSGQNIEHMIAGLVQAGMPLVQIFVALGGGLALGALHAAAAALSALTGFLNDNRDIAVALAVVLSVNLARGLLETAYLQALYAKDAALATAAMVKQKAEVLIASARWNGLGGTLRAAGSGLLSLISPMGVVTAALITGGFAFEAFAAASRKAKQYAASFTDGLNPSDIDGTAAAIGRLTKARDDAFAKLKSYANAGGVIEGAAQVLTPFTKNTVVEQGKLVDALNNQIDSLQSQMSTVKHNAQDAAAQVGLLISAATYQAGGAGDNVIEQFIKLAQSNNIDLSKPGQGVDELAAKWKSLNDTVGGGISKMTASSQVDIDQLQAMAQAISDAGDAAAKAFGNAEDIVSGFDLQATAADVKKAQDTLAKSQQAVTKAQKEAAQTEGRLTGKRKLSVAQQQQLSNAHDKLTAALNDAKTAQQNLDTVTQQAAHPDQQYRKFLTDQLKQAQDFVSGVQEATRRGLNQNTVAQLLEAGPQAASPVLQAIAADHSGDLIKLVNQTQATLANLNQQTVEDARLTQRAIQSTSDQMSKDLSTALNISNLEIGAGGALTAEDVAKKLGISVDVAKRIGDEFGITFSQAMQQTVSANAAEFSARFAQPTSSVYRSQVPRYATGGYVTGPGTTTSDSILARVSRNEYINRAAAVSYYGRSYFDALNALRLPKFAAGGFVGGGSSAGYPGTVQYITQIQVEQVVTPDPASFIREMDRKKQLANLSGRSNG